MEMELYKNMVSSENIYKSLPILRVKLKLNVKNGTYVFSRLRSNLFGNGKTSINIFCWLSEKTCARVSFLTKL